jgi:hypothetical protein
MKLRDGGTAVFVAFAVMTVFVVAATASGESERLCKAMGGTYTPAPPPADVCPGGSWLVLFGISSPRK